MTDYHIYNAGSLVSVKINLSDFKSQHDLSAAVSEASGNLGGIWFESETETYNYGDSVSYYLVIYGTPIGDFAAEVKKRYETDQESERQRRLESARRIVRDLEQRK